MPLKYPGLDGIDISAGPGAGIREPVRVPIEAEVAFPYNIRKCKPVLEMQLVLEHRSQLLYYETHARCLEQGFAPGKRYQLRRA